MLPRTVIEYGFGQRDRRPAAHAPAGALRVDAIAEHVGFRGDHVAEMNGDPQHDRRWQIVLRSWRNESLHLARPFDRIEGAREARRARRRRSI